ncbi:MAG: hypothetical protein Q8886_02680 [Candidatus Phytoplasma australasiaticum]|nr:hypothetical protein [Candidatus Phytoplasma australasiaticum]
MKPVKVRSLVVSVQPSLKARIIQSQQEALSDDSLKGEDCLS